MLYPFLLCCLFLMQAAAAKSEPPVSSPSKPRGASSPAAAPPPPPFDDDDAAMIRQLVQQLTTRMRETSALAGRFSRLRRNVFRIVSRQEWYLIKKCIGEAMQASWQDVLLLTLFGYALVPAVKLLGLHSSEHVGDPGTASEYTYGSLHDDDDAAAAAPFNHLVLPPQSSSPPRETQSLALIAAHCIQQVAQIALIVHAVDLLQMLAMGLGYVDVGAPASPTPVAATTGVYRSQHRSLSQWVCATLYAAWATRKVSLLAQWVVQKHYGQWFGHIDEQQQQHPSSMMHACSRFQRIISMAVYATAAYAWLIWNFAAPAFSMPAAMTIATLVAGLVGFVSLQEILQQVWSGTLYVTGTVAGVLDSFRAFI